MNKNHLLIVFNKSIRMGNSATRGRNVSANGSDLNQGDIVGFGSRYIKLAPHAFDLVVLPNMNAAVLRDNRNRDSIINQDDVDMIREVETNRIIWTSPNASEIVIELDKASRPKPQIVVLSNNGPAVVRFSRFNSIPFAWTVGLDFQKFPFFMKLHVGIVCTVKDAKTLEFEFLGDVSPFETFYVARVYKRNGGMVLWQKP